MIRVVLTTVTEHRIYASLVHTDVRIEMMAVCVSHVEDC
jgi:hypothetical protein